MKLIQRTNRNFLFAGLLVLPLSALFLFYGLDYFLKGEIDEQLALDETRIILQLKTNNEIFSVSPILEIQAVQGFTNEFRVIKNVKVYDPIEKEKELFRELHSIVSINGNLYEIKVRHAIIENEDVLVVIGVTMLLLLILVIITLFIFNNRASKKTWKPFYQNLEIIKKFSLEDKNKPVFINSKIEEFNSLSTTLNELTSKIQNDYDTLKEFAENASHEIQTPLTVISMNLEEMLQEEMSEANYGKLYSILQSTQKLSKLNEKLLLLSKLENNQFHNSEEINLTELVKIKLEEFTPILEDQEIKIEVKLENDFYVLMDPFLANLMISNLLSNAVKHNNESKLIQINVGSDEIVFKNTSKGVLEMDKIFNRFHKQTTNKNSVGLGLSIVKKIIDVSNLNISVSRNSEIFTLQINKRR